MVFKSGDSLRTITEGLGWIVHTCKLQGMLKLFDNHVQAQRFFCRVLNLVYGLQLTSMDQIQANYPAIDLGDSTNRIAYQITTEKGGDKVQHTLDKFVEHDLRNHYDALKILVIGERQGTYKSVVIPAALQFDCAGDIIGIEELLKDIQGLETGRLDELAAIFSEELKDSTESRRISTSGIRLSGSVTTKREELEILRKASHGILDALKFLWMDHGGDMKDLEGRDVGHYLEAIGHTAAHLEPALPAFAEHFGLLARVSRKPYGTIMFTASSTTEYVIRHGISLAQGIDGAFRDRTIRKQEGLTDDEREVYRKSWRLLREPFSNSCMLPTYAKCVELAAEVDWEFRHGSDSAVFG